MMECLTKLHHEDSYKFTEGQAIQILCIIFLLFNL